MASLLHVQPQCLGALGFASVLPVQAASSRMAASADLVRTAPIWTLAVPAYYKHRRYTYFVIAPRGGRRSPPPVHFLFARRRTRTGAGLDASTRAMHSFRPPHDIEFLPHLESLADSKTARVYDAVVHVLPDAAKVLGAVAKL